MSEHKDDNEPKKDSDEFSTEDSLAQQDDLHSPEQIDQESTALHCEGSDEPELFISSIEQREEDGSIAYVPAVFKDSSHSPESSDSQQNSNIDLDDESEFFVDDAEKVSGEPELFIDTIEALHEPPEEFEEDLEFEQKDGMEEFIDESELDLVNEEPELKPIHEHVQPEQETTNTETEPSEEVSESSSNNDIEEEREKEPESDSIQSEPQYDSDDNESFSEKADTFENLEESPEIEEQSESIQQEDDNLTTAADIEDNPESIEAPHEQESTENEESKPEAINEEEAEPESVEDEAVAEENSSEQEQEEAEVSAEDMEYMSDTSAAMLMKTPKGGRLLIYIMMLAIASSLIWASMAPLDEITRGVGNVVPSSRLQVIQNLEGGILETLYVQEGELVREGQPLMQLDDTRFTSTFREGAIEYYSELARAARLSAELTEKNLKFPPELDEYQDYVNREVQIYEKRAAGLASELDIANTQASQAKHELASAEAQLEFLSTSFKLGKEELDLTAPLAKLGVVSQVEMIQLRQRVNELGSEKKLTELSIPKLEAAYQEALARKREVKIKFREEVVQELKEAEIRLDQLTETQTNLKDQVVRTMVRSPVEGIVKKINLTTVGGVIQPGMDLMEIVPVEDNLLVEVQISPKDIGFLRVGMRAIVKLTAYDFAIYGGLEGSLDHISADTIKDEKGESFYIVRIRTAKSHLGTENNPLEIIPGMKTNVDIITGEKTLMAYLLKPILRAKQNALTER